MAAQVKCDVLIAGAGPAGLATALYLLKAHPELRGRVIALEKARHPRFKTCAGGLIPKSILALRELGLELDVPAVEVMRGTARTETGVVEMYRGDVLCTVIRRDQFDAWLAAKARAAGLEIFEQCRVLDVQESNDAVCAVTDGGSFQATLLVGADGSGSRVRRAVFDRDKETIGRALMTDLPVDPERTPEFVERRYRFDFRCVNAGISGYAWSFPCLIDGRPHLNVGIYDQRPPRQDGVVGTAAMLDALRTNFADLDLSGLGKRAMTFKAFPVRWFDPADRFVKGRVILAGDAAGVDPLMGEGISCAFEHGKLAANAIARFLGGGDDALARYGGELRDGAVGRKLRKLAFAARHFYGPRHKLYFRLAGISRKAQEVGVDWYNGAAHLDELSTRALIARWLRAVLFGVPVR